MSDQNDSYTTTEFASLTGLPARQITRLLREGRLAGEKKAGKWVIPASQLKTEAVMKTGKTPESDLPSSLQSAGSPEPRQEKRTYSVAEFAEMTYLTPAGVEKWVREGRLQAASDENGRTRIDGSNLGLPAVKRLVR